jgi:Trp operon repressor
MTQLSKRQLNKDTEKRIYEIFTHVLADASSQDDITALLYDFLTPTERVMLPKRLCIAYLLFKEYDQRAISHYLNVSFTTITKVNTALKNDGKGYKTMLERIQKKAFNDMLETIESGILGFLSKVSRKSAVWKKVKDASYPHTMSDRTPDIL